MSEQLFFTGTESLPSVIDHFGKNPRVLVFINQSARERFSLFFDSVLQSLSVVAFVGNISPNPKIEDVHSAVMRFASEDYDVLLAVGGGSVMDFAKAFRCVSQKQRPLIAIPTTAGSGAEATRFAVVYRDGKKESLDDISLRPDAVLLDGRFIKNMSAYQKATSAADAVCQAIESFWAVGGNDQSREYARAALKKMLPVIERFCGNVPASSEDSDAMIFGSYFAGKAIDISRTTAAHALSYFMTTQYKIPHGHAVALSLGDVFEKNYIGSDGLLRERLNEILAILNWDPANIRESWRRFMEKLHLEWRFSKLGIDDRQAVARAVNPSRLANNPVELPVSVIETFWQE